jgi:hypothetical protein
MPSTGLRIGADLANRVDLTSRPGESINQLSSRPITLADTMTGGRR